MSEDERGVAIARAEDAIRRLSGICRLQKTCHPDVFCSTLPPHWRSNKSLPTPFVVVASFPVRDGTKVTVAAGNDENFCADVKNNVAEMNGQVARFSDLRFVGKSGRGKNFNLSITLHTTPVSELIVVPNVIKVTVDGPRDSRNASKYLNGEYVPRKRQSTASGLVVSGQFGQPTHQFFAPSTSSMAALRQQNPRPFHPPGGIMPLGSTSNSSAPIPAPKFATSSAINLMTSTTFAQSKLQSSANANMIPPANFLANAARMNQFAAALATFRPSAFTTPTQQTSIASLVLSLNGSNAHHPTTNGLLYSNQNAFLTSPFLRLPLSGQTLTNGVQVPHNPALNFLAAAAAAAAAPFFALPPAQSQALLAAMNMASTASAMKENANKSLKSAANPIPKGAMSKNDNPHTAHAMSKLERANVNAVTWPLILGLQNTLNSPPTPQLAMSSQNLAERHETGGDNSTSFEDLTPSPTTSTDLQVLPRDNFDPDLAATKFLAGSMTENANDDNNEHEMENTSDTAFLRQKRKIEPDFDFTTTTLSADSATAPFPPRNDVEYSAKRQKLLAELADERSAAVATAIVAATSTHQRSSASDVWRPFN